MAPYLYLHFIQMDSTRPQKELVVATTMRALVLNVSLTLVETTVAALGAVAIANGGITNAPEPIPVRNL